jgi:hypothetical protein
MKINNLSHDLLKNPFVCIIIALFTLLIILGIIRLFQPDFSMGAEFGAHFGSIDGKIKLEAYENEKHQEEHNQEEHYNHPVLKRIQELSEENKFIEKYRPKDPAGPCNPGHPLYPLCG